MDVDRRGGLVEDQHRRVGEVGAHQAHQLTLAVAEVRALWADRGAIALLQPFEDLVGAEFAAGGDQLVVAGVGAGEAEVVEHGARKKHVVLQHHADVPAQLALAHRAHVGAVDQHRTVLDFVEA